MTDQAYGYRALVLPFLPYRLFVVVLVIMLDATTALGLVLMGLSPVMIVWPAVTLSVSVYLVLFLGAELSITGGHWEWRAPFRTRRGSVGALVAITKVPVLAIWGIHRIHLTAGRPLWIVGLNGFDRFLERLHLEHPSVHTRPAGVSHLRSPVVTVPSGYFETRP